MKKLTLIGLILSLGLPSYSQWYDTEFNWDTIGFEKNYEYVKIDTLADNIWQIGTPRKAYFDSAHSGDKAIITDTLNSYPVNNHSYFDLYIGQFNYNQYYPWDIFIEFKHKFDTDSLLDGGYITVSYNNGENWINIIEDSMSWCALPAWENENLYTDKDELYNGEVGFSGNSNGWINTWFTWHQCLVKSSKTEIGDTMIIRFNFISDGIDSDKEGWLIDNIRLYSVDLGGAISENAINDNIKIYPNPSSGKSIIELGDFYQKIDIAVFDLSGKQMSVMNFENAQTITLDSDINKPGEYIILIRLDTEDIGVKKWIIE